MQIRSLVVAARDPRLEARVVARRPLVYTERPAGAPPHVRAASGLCRFGRGLAVVQDDAAFLGLVEDEAVRAVPLPPGPGGLRVFEERLGHKRLKPDFEACVAAPDGAVYAFGSGSTPARERVARLRPDEATTFDASALYAALRACAPFAGSELNVEGALLLPGGTLRLFQRGNGAGEAVDATADLDWAAVLASFDGGPAPALRAVAPYALGAIDGVRLTFTDAALGPGAVLFLASAEDAPDTYRDGRVTGSAIGVFDPDGAARWAPLVDAAGRPLAVKAEGLEVDDRGAWVVLDFDDPDRPSELLRVELRGPWWLAAA